MQLYPDGDPLNRKSTNTGVGVENCPLSILRGRNTFVRVVHKANEQCGASERPLFFKFF